MNHNFPSSIDNNNNPPNPNFNPNPNFPYFPSHSLLPGYTGGEVRGRELEYRRNGVDVRGSILRELEKERIRAELIAEEIIIRRRVLEEEVRREMMLERELCARRRRAPPMFGVGTMRLEPPRVGLETMPRGAMRVEPPRVPLLMNSEGRVGFETVPFQRDPVVGASGSGGGGGGVSRVVKEVNGVVGPAEGDKGKVVILAKPSTNLADIKRKAMAQSVGGAIEILKKQKTDEDWSCALCRITATSERGLNEHLQGKKHKARERGMVSQTQRIGFGSGSTASSKNDENVDNAATPDSSGIKDSQTVIMSKEISAEGRENGVPGALATDRSKKRFRYFCEMCEAGAYSLKVFNKHKRSNKHLASLSKLNKSDDALPIEVSVQIAVMEENMEAEMSGKETKEDSEREQVATNRENVNFHLDRVEVKVEVPETKGDNVDGEVNRVEDKGLVLETKGDDVDSYVNRVEDKFEVPEIKGDNVDGEVNRVEDKGMVLETKGDDVGSELNQVEDKEKILETKADDVDSYVNRVVDKVGILETKGGSVDGEVNRVEDNGMETKADNVNQVENLEKVLETKGDDVDSNVNQIDDKETVLEIVG